MWNSIRNYEDLKGDFTLETNDMNTGIAVSPGEGGGMTPSSSVTTVYRPELDTTMWPSAIALTSHSNNVQRRSRNGKGCEKLFTLKVIYSKSDLL